MSDGLCADGLVGKTGIDFFIPGSGSFLLGVTRIAGLSLLMINDWRNRISLNKKSENSFHIAKGLVLPSYFIVIYCLMSVDFISGIIDLSFSFSNISNNTRSTADSWILPIECGAFHCIFEGLTLFLLRYGAGKEAFRKSLQYGFIWGLITASVYVIELRLFLNIDDIDGKGIKKPNENIPYAIFVCYCGILAVFYSSILIIPNRILYKRPAIRLYAYFNLLLQWFWIISATIVRFYSISAICGVSIASLFLLAIVQPIIVWITLKHDSQYWQGLSPDKGNPLAEVWDQLDIATATSIGDILTTYEDQRKHVPFLHFGLITLDKNVGFVAGGFSRVYFGKIKREEKVALKVMFAMELTPQDITEFFTEAKILYSNNHPNIVKCIGVCVMPPAVAIVLEYCRYGSLFDFLHQSNIQTNNNNVGRDGYVAQLSPDLRHLSSKHSSSNLTRTNSIDALRKKLEIESTHSNRLRESYVSWGISNPDSNPAASIKSIIATWNVYDSNSETTSELDVKSLRSLSISESQSFYQNHGNISNNITSQPISNPINSNFQNLNIETSNNIVIDEDSRDSSVISRLSTNIRGYINSTTDLTIANVNRIKSSSYNYISQGTTGINNIIKSASVRLGIRQSEQINKETTDILDNLPLAYGISYITRHKMMLDCIRSIEFLHSKGYLHCDIKSLNFLVSDDFVVKLSDMGESREITAPPKRDRPPIPARNWAPPEVLQKDANPNVYTIKSEIFGLAIVLAEILSLTLPFGSEPDSMKPDEWYNKLTQENIRPYLPSNTPIKIRNILEQSWHNDMNKRPTATEIYQIFDENLQMMLTANDDLV